MIIKMFRRIAYLLPIGEMFFGCLPCLKLQKHRLIRKGEAVFFV